MCTCLFVCLFVAIFRDVGNNNDIGSSGNYNSNGSDDRSDYNVVMRIRRTIIK